MMSTYDKERRALSICFEQEIDHHICDIAKKEVDYEIQKNLPKTLIFDFKNVKFMDSSGIGMILGRYKHMLRLVGEVLVTNTSEKVRKILEMSGIQKIIPILEEVIK